ncbi:MAG: proline racemase family protein [Steroidobacteraceae bacterium]
MSGASARRLQVVDSHTGGEPTRIVVGGGPELAGDLARQLAEFRSGHDELRGALINEPRGSDVLVGGLLRPGVSTGATAGILFFNNVGYLGMCGHGTIGLVTTLEHLGRIAPGEHLIDTPVGPVRARLHDSGEVSVRNVPAFRQQQGLRLTVPGLGEVSGDVAWGGNWFFICEDHGLTVDAGNLPALLAAGSAIQERLQACGIRGGGGALIDHVELCGPSSVADSRNFVLCPGGAYDRSPCGTGTSAKLACLAADGQLEPGEPWRQESVIGSIFEARYELASGEVLPTITGRAWITGEATLLIDPRDPFAHGIRPQA